MRRVGGWLRRQLADEIVVHTTQGQTIRGWLEDVSRDGVILRAPRYVEGEGSIPLAGELFIPRERVLFAQVRPKADADD